MNCEDCDGNHILDPSREQRFRAKKQTVEKGRVAGRVNGSRFGKGALRICSGAGQ
jgi:hypothetical protein